MYLLWYNHWRRHVLMCKREYSFQKNLLYQYLWQTGATVKSISMPAVFVKMICNLINFQTKKQISIWPRTRRKLSNSFVFQMISCRHFWNFCFWDWRFHFSIGVSSKLSVGVEWYMTILREGLSYFSTLKRISWENVFILFFCSLYQNAQKRMSITVRTYKQNTYIKCMYKNRNRGKKYFGYINDK